MAKIRWNSPGTFVLITFPFLALFLMWEWLKFDGFSLPIALLAVFFYYATGMSTTGGYHRLFAHRAYEANRLVKIFYLAFGAATFQHSVLQWCSDHRKHHQFVDKEEDPYSAPKGFWYSHLLWMMTDAPLDYEERYVKDLLKDPWIRLQHQYYIFWAILFGIALPTALGACLGSWLGGLAFAGFARIVAVQHFTFFVNSLAHYWGAQTYTKQHTARDNFFVALVTYGEGYHNFHHTFANDYRNGIKWYQFDPTKWMIAGLERLGMTYGLKTTPEAEILAAKIKIDAENLEKSVWESAKIHLEEIRARFEAGKERFASKWHDYVRHAEEYKLLRRQKLAWEQKEFQARVQRLKNEVQIARMEYRLAYAEWRRFSRAVLRQKAIA